MNMTVAPSSLQLDVCYKLGLAHLSGSGYVASSLAPFQVVNVTFHVLHGYLHVGYMGPITLRIIIGCY